MAAPGTAGKRGWPEEHGAASEGRDVAVMTTGVHQPMIAGVRPQRYRHPVRHGVRGQLGPADWRRGVRLLPAGHRQRHIALFAWPWKTGPADHGRRDRVDGLLGPVTDNAQGIAEMSGDVEGDAAQALSPPLRSATPPRRSPRASRSRPRCSPRPRCSAGSAPRWSRR